MITWYYMYNSISPGREKKTASSRTINAYHDVPSWSILKKELNCKLKIHSVHRECWRTDHVLIKFSFIHIIIILVCAMVLVGHCAKAFFCEEYGVKTVLEVYTAYIFWHSFWHILWHSILYLFWHSILHLCWHSIRHSVWHCIWHSAHSIKGMITGIWTTGPYFLTSLWIVQKQRWYVAWG